MDGVCQKDYQLAPWKKGEEKEEENHQVKSE